MSTTPVLIDDPAARLPWMTALGRLPPLLAPRVRTLAACAGILLLLCGAQLAGPLLVRHAIDADIPGKDVRGLLWTSAGYLACLVSVLVLRFVLRVKLETMGQEVLLDLRRKLFAHVLRLSMAFHDQASAGRLIARIQGDTESMRQTLSSTAISLLEAAVLCSGALIVVGLTSWKLAGALALLILVMLAISTAFGIGGMRRYREVREHAARISAHVAEHVQGIPTLQAYAREQSSVDALDGLNRARFVAAVRSNVFFTIVHRAAALFEAAGIVLALAFGGREVLAGAVTLGTLMMMVGYLRRVFEPVAHLADELEALQRATASAGRVFALLDLPERVRDPSDPARWPGFSRDIEFRDVTFSYRDDGQSALRGVSFTIPRGQTWAIVGATGSGKTSILSLLLRFYDPQSGAILVDGHDIRTIPQVDLRRHVALVIQDVHVFPGDVDSNIAPEGLVRDEAHRQRLRDAARASGAAAFIERLPRGYAEPILERGANISAGERQLLALARALARDPEILLLDEATASVDPRSEREIQATLDRLLAGRTAIVIAHRLSTVRHADNILVLERGRVVEQGRHAELLAQGGHYAALHALQFGAGERAEEAS